MTKKILSAALCCITTGFLWAQNPVIQTNFTPDPAPMVYKDKVYMYTGDDIPGFDFYYMTKWRVYSSGDMVNWTDHGSPVSLETFSWAMDRAWAAQCVERNGKFYWYICVQTVDNNMAVGVAVGDSPTGPFKDAIGKPLITTGSWANIDPTVFVDDNGEAYLYWGNGVLSYVKLNSNMISYTGGIVEVPLTIETFGGVRRARPVPGQTAQNNAATAGTNKDMFVEAPWFYKRNGIYYQMFAGMEKGKECLSYSTSTGPTGPWKYQGRVMVDQPTNSFTNHGGIIDFKGKSYLFYHNALLPGGGSYGRSSAIEEMKYNEDGTIPQVTMTKEGPSAVGTIDPYKRMEAETIAWSTKCKTAEDPKTGVYVSDIRTGGYVKVKSVDFGTTAPKTFSASLAAGLDGGILEVYADSIKGPKLATINVSRTGGWNSWKTFTTDVTTNITGVRDVYFSFKGKNITLGRLLFNFDYWLFKK